MSRKLRIFPLAILVLFALACGDDDDQPSPGSVTPVVTPAGSVVIQNPIVPPLEGADRGPAATERTDFRLDPAYQLPTPDDVPPPLEGSTNPLLHPPAPSECPDDWTIVDRPEELFRICYPEGWEVAGTGYVSAGAEERWYSIGFVNFADEEELRQHAHVSVYVVPQFARPFLNTKDCEQAYSVTFAGQPAVVCPEHVGVPPEANIATYHVFTNDRDYFVNIVPYFEYEDGEYTDEIDEEILTEAIGIAFTFQFIENLGNTVAPEAEGTQETEAEEAEPTE